MVNVASVLFHHLLFVFSVAIAAKRSVAVVGPTNPPDFVRQEAKKPVACPTSHPFPMEGGTKCCADYSKANNPSLHADCDGLAFNVADSELCCSRSLDCPVKESGQRCRVNPLVSRVGGWSEWSSWSVQSPRDYHSKEVPHPEAWEEGKCLTVLNPPSGSTVEYCHLERVTYNPGNFILGEWGYWDDLSEDIPPFSRVNYTGGSDSRWTVVDFYCADDISQERAVWVNYWWEYVYAHRIKVYARWACSRPGSPYQETRTRFCRNPKPIGELGSKCPGLGKEYKGTRYLGVFVGPETHDGTDFEFIASAIFGKVSYWHSQNKRHPYMALKYPDPMKIVRVDVHKRPEFAYRDRFRDVQVHVGNRDIPKGISSAMIPGNVLCEAFTGTEEPFYPVRTFECPQPYLLGQYIVVQISYTSNAGLEVSKIEAEFYPY